MPQAHTRGLVLRAKHTAEAGRELEVAIFDQEAVPGLAKVREAET